MEVRRRLIMAAFLAVVLPLGFWLRYSAPIPEWLRDRSGGALYVMAGMFAIALIRPNAAPWRIALFVFVATCCIEFSQLLHPAWLVWIRSHRAGRLFLGSTFDWMDFFNYAIGAVLGWAALKFVSRSI